MEEDGPDPAALACPTWGVLALEGSGEPGQSMAAQSPARRRSLFQHRLQIAKQLSGLTSPAQRAYCAADPGERRWLRAIPGTAGRQRDAGGA